MQIVVDTNVFLAVVLGEAERDRMIRATRGRQLVAPEVFPFEVGNALSAMVRNNRLNPSGVAQAWNTLQLVPVELRKVNFESALQIAALHSIYAYDAYFVECALSTRLPLLTLDKEMARVARQLGITVLE